MEEEKEKEEEGCACRTEQPDLLPFVRDTRLGGGEGGVRLMRAIAGERVLIDTGLIAIGCSYRRIITIYSNNSLIHRRDLLIPPPPLLRSGDPFTWRKASPTLVQLFVYAGGLADERKHCRVRLSRAY